MLYTSPGAASTSGDPLVCRKEDSVQTEYARAQDARSGGGMRKEWRGGENEDEMGDDEKQNWSTTMKQEVEQEGVMRWLGESMRCGALELTVQRSGIRDALRNWSASMNGWCRAQAGGCEAITGQREETDSVQVVVIEDKRACTVLNRNGLWLRLRRRRLE